MPHFFRQGLFAALLGAAAATAAAMPEVPALVKGLSSEHHTGKVVFLELVTPNLAATKKFYGDLLGWKFTDIRSGDTNYAEATLDGIPVAGLIHRKTPAGAPQPPAWLNYMSVRDVDAARTAALERGAKLLWGPRNVPHRGREAIFADPQGAVFAVLASSSGDPPDVLADYGEWIWSTLITTDPDADAAFYQALFDYEIFDLPAVEGAQHYMFASDDYLRASANTLPANKPDMKPHWLNFVRVNNAGVMAAKVVELGGRLLIGPRVDRHGGMVAVVEDPQGATFGLLEWPDTERKETPK